MKSRTATITHLAPSEQLRPPSLRAPDLGRVVDALLARAHDPNDRRAKIAVALLAKEGALDCAACGETLDVAGYRETRTHFHVRRSISCTTCRTSFVIEDQHVA